MKMDAICVDKSRKIEGKSMKINEMTRCIQNKELKLKIEYSNKTI